MSNQKKRRVIGIFLLVVALVVVGWWLINRGKESTDDAVIEAHTIAVSAKVPGYIVALHVMDNQAIKKGDVLAEIDPRDYELRVAAAKANLASAEASAGNATVNAKRQLTIGKAAGTQRDIDNALATASTANAAVEYAKTELAIAEKDLADTKLIAPEDGVIAMRTAEEGEYVTTGEQLMMVVGTDRWVVANFKEVQLTDMRPGQKADISIDAYPSLKLTGHVDSIQRGTGARFSAFPPENATGNFVKIVQRVPVKIFFDSAIPADIVLGPGLSVHPTVYTAGTK
jgi:membrane fusion protein (multidrug efflux system)